jgi:hypothetical protein
MASESTATDTRTTATKKTARSTSSRSSTRSKSAQGGRSPSKSTAAKSASSRTKPRTATVALPFVTAEFRAPEVHLPRSVPTPSLESVPLVGRLPRPHVPEAAKRQVMGVAHVVGPQLPERSQLTFFAGLGVVAAAGLIEWPVAAAVAVGTVVARKAGRSSTPRSATSSSDSKAKAS